MVFLVRLRLGFAEQLFDACFVQFGRESADVLVVPPDDGGCLDGGALDLTDGDIVIVDCACALVGEARQIGIFADDSCEVPTCDLCFTLLGVFIEVDVVVLLIYVLRILSPLCMAL